MLFNFAAPGQTIYAAWKYAAMIGTPGVYSFAMSTTQDDVMASPGHMAVLGDVFYTVTPPPPGGATLSLPKPTGPGDA